MFAARRIHRTAITCALTCALLTTAPALAQGRNNRLTTNHRGASECQTSQAWTPTQTQIRSALAQERYYMSFGRQSQAWTPTQTQIRRALAQERHYMGRH